MARTRGKDSLTPATDRSGRRRREVYVFTEGKVTEPDYIAIVRGRAVYADPAVRVDVHIANQRASDSDRQPLKLVEAAASLMEEKTREARRSRLKQAYWPQVWCLFDRDQHESIDTVFGRARRAGVRVAFSHPCFEVWRLLHLKEVTGTFGGVCRTATARLPFARSTANIKSVLPEQIPKGSFGEAKDRARKMNAAHGDHVPMSARDPYTDVYAFVEEGLGIASY
ncbi:RloB family protein [Streptomyces sp. DSM 44917]|uniref:RloB family protein n=1 Tax=Streptomyces boetiae TaxID=3075541 RepID=A0ABU2LFE3_9ACTN|nr:RloB family protein [Streptomyces sp. DSM 44917]MDT0310309.1 RloB family protein [Streptomyces sp. DSM 44917]